MATLGHLAVGLAAGRLHLPRDATPPTVATTMAALALLSFAPDADVIAFALGIPYGAPWGHRGAAHSPVFGLLLGALLGLLLPLGGRPRWQTMLTASAVIASHGLLDTLTDGGLGIALLWPFSHRRIFAPWRPFEVAPIGTGMLSARGLHILLGETVIFSPLLLYALWPR
jgi:inner membrane protein